MGNNSEAKRILITGATSAHGLETARKLANAGYQLIITSRERTKAWETRKRIIEIAPNASVAIQSLDLASLHSIREFAAEAISRYPTIDAILNNAQAPFLPKRALTQDKFETNFGVNHLGHFALTGLLAPIMPAHSRVVTVYSQLAKYGKLRFHDLKFDHSYTPLKAYGTSKLANLLFSAQLHRKNLLGETELISVAAHVGNINNPYHSLGLINKLGRIANQSDQNAAEILYFALTNNQISSGDCVGPDGALQLIGKPKIVEPLRIKDADLLAQRLWLISGQLTRIPW